MYRRPPSLRKKSGEETLPIFFCGRGDVCTQAIHTLHTYNCHHSTTTTASFFRDWRKSQEYSRNLNCMACWWFTRRSHFDSAPFINTAAVSINCPATILIALRALHVFSCWHFDSKHYLIFLSLYFISMYYFRWIPRWIRRSPENANPNDSTFSSPQTSTAFKIKDSDCARNIEHLLLEKLYTHCTLIPSINLILPTEDIFSRLLGLLRVEPLFSIQRGRFSVYFPKVLSSVKPVTRKTRLHFPRIRADNNSQSLDTH